MMSMLFALLLGAQSESPPSVTHRLAVLAAQNDGGATRVKLRHTEQDARAFADVLVELGGVAREDVTLVVGGFLEVRHVYLRVGESYSADEVGPAIGRKP